MKYVMFKLTVRSMTRYEPVMFSNSLAHADVAQAMQDGPLKGYSVHSAGEYRPMTAECHGHSTTLGVESDPLDGQRIRMADYGGLIE